MIRMEQSAEHFSPFKNSERCEVIVVVESFAHWQENKKSQPLHTGI